MKTPFEEVSEAEANVCTEARARVHTRSIEDDILLSRFFGDLYPYRIRIALQS